MGQFIFTQPPPVGTQSITYVATGAEGHTLVLPQLTGHQIDLVTYNTLVLIPESSPPDAQGYFFSGDTITFGINLQLDDVVQILYT